MNIVIGIKKITRHFVIDDVLSKFYRIILQDLIVATLKQDITIQYNIVSTKPNLMK